MWRKEREVGNKEARLSTLRLHPSVTDWQLSPCRDEPLAPAPCGVSTSHSVLSNCAPWDTQWPHLTSSGCRLFCLSFLSSARNLFSLAIFFLWHLLLNTSNHVRIGFSGKIARKDWAISTAFSPIYCYPATSVHLTYGHWKKTMWNLKIMNVKIIILYVCNDKLCYCL